MKKVQGRVGRKIALFCIIRGCTNSYSFQHPVTKDRWTIFRYAQTDGTVELDLHVNNGVEKRVTEEEVCRVLDVDAIQFHNVPKPFKY